MLSVGGTETLTHSTHNFAEFIANAHLRHVNAGMKSASSSVFVTAAVPAG